jgi:hypothetical protein
MAPSDPDDGVTARGFCDTGRGGDLCVSFAIGATCADLPHQGLREDGAAGSFTDRRTVVLNHVPAVVGRGTDGQMCGIHTRRVVANLMANKQSRGDFPVVQLPGKAVCENSLSGARDGEESVALRQHASPSPALIGSALVDVAPELLSGGKFRRRSDRWSRSRGLTVQKPPAIAGGTHSSDDLGVNAGAPRDSAGANGAGVTECTSTKRVTVKAPSPVVGGAPSATDGLLATLRDGTDIIRHVGPFIQVRPNPGQLAAVAGPFSLTVAAA